MTAIFSSFVIAFFTGLPVAFALGVGGLIYLILQDASPVILSSELFSSLSSPGLMAIPFFILAAEIMSRSGATGRLIHLIDTLIRHTRGGMPLIAVIATAMFSSISGSSVATAASVGTVLLPELKKRGYNPLVSVGLIATAGGLGILIPPSVPLVVYGMVTETSIGKLFAAGGIVGVALTIILGIAAYIYGAYSGVAPLPRATRMECKQALISAIGVLLSPILVLGGIYSGLFTPMEAAAVSAVYSLVLAVCYGYRNKELLHMLTSAATTASVIMMILAGAQLLGYAITNERIPYEMFDFITSLDLSITMFMLLIIIFFLIAGMFLEVISVILISMPILMPLLVGYEIDPIFFAVILILNMEIAVITPPIGMNLFAMSAISGMSVMRVFKGSLPFVGILLTFLLAMAFIPGVQSIFMAL